MSSDIGRRRRSDDNRLSTVCGRFCRRVRERFRQCPDTEVEQNIVRTFNALILIGYGITYLFITGGDVRGYVAAVGPLMLYPIAIFVWIYLSPAKSVLRRLTHLFADQGIIAFLMIKYGDWMSPAYILYFLQGVGYGARYGRPYLYLSTAISAVGFGIVILFNDFWRTLIPLNIGLWIAILVLPYHAGLFFRRLTTLNDRLHDLATRDTLTGLPNRPFLYERLREAIAAAERHNRQFAVMFVDIDNFKKINDTHGHEAGDAALRATARILRDAVRRADTVARLGGDEFVVLLHDTRANIQIADNFRDALAIYTPHLSASVGIATYPDCGQDAEALVRHADHAMYEAKRAGKNRSYVCPDVLGRISRSARH